MKINGNITQYVVTIKHAYLIPLNPVKTLWPVMAWDGRKGFYTMQTEF